MTPLPSGLRETVGESEDLARFLLSSRDHVGGVVKPVAFLPNPKDANRETSVFRHGAGVPELWELAIGNDVVPLGRTLHGAAIVRAGRVMALSLSVVAAEPPERHAGVRNWPWTPDDPVTTKARQLELAQELVRYADLVLKA